MQEKDGVAEVMMIRQYWGFKDEERDIAIRVGIAIKICRGWVSQPRRREGWETQPLR